MANKPVSPNTFYVPACGGIIEFSIDAGFDTQWFIEWDKSEDIKLKFSQTSGYGPADIDVLVYPRCEDYNGGINVGVQTATSALGTIQINQTYSASDSTFTTIEDSILLGTSSPSYTYTIETDFEIFAYTDNTDDFQVDINKISNGYTITLSALDDVDAVGNLIISSGCYTYTRPIAYTKWKYMDLDYPESLGASAGTFNIQVSSNTDWSIVQIDGCTVNKSTGTGDDIVTVSYPYWVAGMKKYIYLKFDSPIGSKEVRVSQDCEYPYATISNSVKTIPFTGGRIVFDNYDAATNCQDVTLSTNVGTITPSTYKGTWGEVTSIDFVLDVPQTIDARTITVTAKYKSMDNSSYTSTFDILQEAIYTFTKPDTSTPSVDVKGGQITKQYNTTAPSVTMDISNVSDRVIDFTYTQPVNGVGTYTITYGENYLSSAHTEFAHISAYFDGVFIGTITQTSYQSGTQYSMPTVNKEIPFNEQVMTYYISNSTLDLKRDNIALWSVVDGVEIESYTPAISSTDGILKIKIPANDGIKKTYTITIKLLDENGEKFASKESITITQLAYEPIIVDKSVLQYPTYGGTQTFEILANGIWTIATDQGNYCMEWFTVDKTSGSGDAVLQVTCNSKEYPYEKVGHITIDDGVSPVTVTVRQDASIITAEFLPFSPIPAKGGRQTLTLYGSVEGYECSFPLMFKSGDWYSITPAEVNFNSLYDINIIVEENPYRWSRTAYVNAELISQGGEKTGGFIITNGNILQLAADIDPILSVNKTNIEFDYYASTEEIRVYSNSEWTCSISGEGFRLDKYTGQGNDLIKIIATDNNSLDVRTATLTIQIDGLDPLIITITQDGAEIGIPIEDKTIDYSASVINYSVDDPTGILTDDNFTIQSSLDGVTKKGYSDGVLAVNVPENIEVETREFTITLIVTDAQGQRLTRVVQNVKQLGAPIQFNVLPRSFVVYRNGSEEVLNIKSNASWTITGTPSWIVPSAISGNGDDNVTLTILDNNKGQDREALFFAKAGTTVLPISVRQYGYAKITDYEIILDAAYHNYNFNILMNAEWWAKSQANWINITPTNGSGAAVMRIQVDVNPEPYDRVGYIMVYGVTETYRIRVTQSCLDTNFVQGDASPICIPQTLVIEDTSAEYHLNVDGSTVYSGLVYKYPDADKIEVELNDVMSDFLSNSIEFKTGYFEMPGFMKEFIVKTNQNQSTTYNVFNAWEIPDRAFLNDPISNEVDPRQYIFVNYIDGYGALTLYENGGEAAAISSIKGMSYVLKDRVQACGTTLNYDLKYEESNLVDVLQFTYGDGNKDYVLYYVNAYGGWDSLLVGGNVMKRDEFTSHTYRNKNRGKVKYLNEISEKWQLYTGNMNDGSKMYHLLESNEVYLHNLKTDKITPVTITDSTCEYKTYANQGNTRFHYVINVESSNYKIRK